MAQSEDRRGTIAGEGAGAFLLSRPGTSVDTKRIARLLAIDAKPTDYNHPEKVNTAKEVAFIIQAITKTGYSVADIDFFLFGANGNSVLDSSYNALERALSDIRGRDIRYGVYKQFCGEYCTASAVGLGVALSVLRGPVPDGVELSKPNIADGKISNVLLYNLSDVAYHSVCLVSL